MAVPIALTRPEAAPLGDTVPDRSIEAADSSRAPSQSETLPRQTDPFGTVTAVRVVISPPLEQIPRNWRPVEAPVWVVPVAGNRQLQAYLVDSGLAAADVKIVLDTAKAVEGGGMVVYPPVDLVRRLTPEVRAKLYVPLMHDMRNRAQAEAYRYAGDTVEQWLGHAPISDETRRLVEPFVYRHTGFLYFADIDVIRSQLDDGELQRLVKGLLRHSTVLLKLSVPDATKVQEIVEYWGRGGRRTDIRPLIESIAETGEQIDVSHLLPPLAREHLYRYPRVTAADLDRPALNNCFWTALNFFGPEPDNRYLELDYALTHLKSNYYVVHNDLQLGDVIAFLDDEFNVFHAAVYLADGYVFSKNGFSSLAPWTILPLEDLKGHYFQFAQNWRLTFHRRKDM
ncbi:MAG: hypothetical protein IT183_10060 [Acidobacteria bacterium]|nr:hypothetical protein [Acidobacteriota bacterium]